MDALGKRYDTIDAITAAPLIFRSAIPCAPFNALAAILKYDCSVKSSSKSFTVVNVIEPQITADAIILIKKVERKQHIFVLTSLGMLFELSGLRLDMMFNLLFT